MHRLYRHFFAATFCITLFSVTGTANGIARLLAGNPEDQAAVPSLPVGWFMNFVMMIALTLMIIMPVCSIADYLLDSRWSLPVLWQIPAIVPVFVAYVFVWSLIFGKQFLQAAAWGTGALIFPVLVYWCIFRVTALRDLTDS
ncbi:MAG TPA: hypothetical protein VG733_04435 [Chthoniobacteraceae bacterium]|nr:hypothetical protein [Chthoniobacteraceae bacterium]